MNVKTLLKSRNKKTINKSELASLLCTSSDAELYRLVSEAVLEGLLAPVKSSGTSGNKIYPLYFKYRITIADDYAEALSEIALLHPSLTKSGYLQSKPELYLKYKAQLKLLNAYLFKEKSSASISKKERSFEIFGEEKQMEDRAFKNLLNRLGLTADVLAYYETPEYCFNDYIPHRSDNILLLICENKDIWFNIRRRMFEDSVFNLFGIHIDGAVYGCGNRISEAGALLQYTHFMNTASVHYIYWGDIDRPGLNIYLSLLKNNPGLDIKLFVPAYEEMLYLSKTCVIPDSDDHRNITADYSEIYSMFPLQARDQLAGLIENNKRIPQEIINYEVLLKVMR